MQELKMLRQFEHSDRWLTLYPRDTFKRRQNILQGGGMKESASAV